MGAPQQLLLSSAAASGAASDFVRLAEVVTTGSQTTISFSSIPGTYRHLRLAISGRSSAAGTTATVAMQFNGDAANNYDWCRRDRTNSTVTRGTSQLEIVTIAASGGPTDCGLGSTVFIPNYVGTIFQKALHAVGAVKNGTGADANIVGSAVNAGFWRSTAAISSILLSLSSGNFVDGTTATLYGIL